MSPDMREEYNRMCYGNNIAVRWDSCLSYLAKNIFILPNRLEMPYQVKRKQNPTEFLSISLKIQSRRNNLVYGCSHDKLG